MTELTAREIRQKVFDQLPSRSAHQLKPSTLPTSDKFPWGDVSPTYRVGSEEVIGLASAGFHGDMEILTAVRIHR